MIVNGCFTTLRAVGVGTAYVCVEAYFNGEWFYEEFEVTVPEPTGPDILCSNYSRVFVGESDFCSFSFLNDNWSIYSVAWESSNPNVLALGDCGIISFLYSQEYYCDFTAAAPGTAYMTANVTFVYTRNGVSYYKTIAFDAPSIDVYPVPIITAKSSLTQLTLGGTLTLSPNLFNFSPSGIINNIYADDIEYYVIQSGDTVSLNASTRVLTAQNQGIVMVGIRHIPTGATATFTVSSLSAAAISAGVTVSWWNGSEGWDGRAIYPAGWYFDYTTPINAALAANAQRCRNNAILPLNHYTEKFTLGYATTVLGLASPAGVAINTWLLGLATEQYVVDVSVKLGWWFSMVKGEAVWDYKYKDSWEAAFPYIPYPKVITGYKPNGLPIYSSGGEQEDYVPFLFRGKIASADDIGNFNYGYCGTALGMSSTLLYWGGGLAVAIDKHSHLLGSWSDFVTAINSETLLFLGPNYGDDAWDHNTIEAAINIYMTAYPGTVVGTLLLDAFITTISMNVMLHLYMGV